ncbi:MAG: PQQ-binding-like beta-propeller repeat protein [Candidatus Dormibacteria bacterium]
MMLSLPAGALRGSAASRQAQGPSPSCTVSGTADRCPDWASAPYGTSNQQVVPGGNFTSEHIEQTSPDGARVYIAGGIGEIGATTSDLFVTAFDSSTGSELWATTVTNTSGYVSDAQALAVSAAQIFVLTGECGCALVALDAATGKIDWQQPLTTDLTDIVASADGRTDVATGYVAHGSAGVVYYSADTLAFDAATGAQLWKTESQGAPGAGWMGDAIVAFPGGTSVGAVLASVNGAGWATGFRLVEYDALSGAVERTGDAPLSVQGLPFTDGAMVTPDGHDVVLVDTTIVPVAVGAFSAADVVDTIAFSAATAQESWSASLNPSGDNGSTAAWYMRPLAMSPDSTRVYVAALSEHATVDTFDTAAYNINDGSQEWLAQLPADEVGGCTCGPMVAADRTGADVYVTDPLAVPGSLAETVALNAGDGSLAWQSMYATAGDWTVPRDIVVLPDSRDVVVPVEEVNIASGAYDVVLVAYPTGVTPSVDVPDLPLPPLAIAALLVAALVRRRARSAHRNDAIHVWSAT